MSALENAEEGAVVSKLTFACKEQRFKGQRFKGQRFKGQCLGAVQRACAQAGRT